jgi:hypothetical protein
MKCPHCKKEMHKKYMTKEMFIKRFKIGQTIYGWYARQMTLTAFGDTRFLYMDKYGKEKVASYHSDGANYREKE